MVDVAEIVHYVHMAVLMAGILVPVCNVESFLKMYSTVIPFLFFHWSINDDTCALTIMEQMIRKETDKHKTFMGQIMNGVYILPEDALGTLIKGVFFGLWMFVQLRLRRLY
jgi:hypothetical protein